MKSFWRVKKKPKMVSVTYQITLLEKVGPVTFHQDTQLVLQSCSVLYKGFRGHDTVVVPLRNITDVYVGRFIHPFDGLSAQPNFFSIEFQAQNVTQAIHVKFATEQDGEHFLNLFVQYAKRAKKQITETCT